MNERILELARQSGGIDMTNHVAGGITTWVGTSTPKFLEQFAELIVRECAKSANDWYQNHDKIHSDPMSYVLAHFGVEE